MRTFIKALAKERKKKGNEATIDKDYGAVVFRLGVVGGGVWCSELIKVRDFHGG